MKYLSEYRDREAVETFIKEIHKNNNQAMDYHGGVWWPDA